jgi:lysozyme family protein
MWGEYFYNESEMLAKMNALGYSRYKKTAVKNPNISFAKTRADETMMKGFQGISNNCLDHTYHVLEGYGVKDMPWKQTNPTPNGWFSAFVERR